MPDNKVSIQIKQLKRYPNILGVTIPFFSYVASSGDYKCAGTGNGCEGNMSALECLVDLLINAEMNRKDRQLGPIYANFELIGDGRQDGLPMEELLRIYARSEKTSVIVEYKETGLKKYLHC